MPLNIPTPTAAPAALLGDTREFGGRLYRRFGNHFVSFRSCVGAFVRAVWLPSGIGDQKWGPLFFRFSLLDPGAFPFPFTASYPALVGLMGTRMVQKRWQICLEETSLSAQQVFWWLGACLPPAPWIYMGGIPAFPTLPHI